MHYDPGFDPQPYYEIAAANLLDNFGETAFMYADEALKKTKLLGQEESFALWLGVMDALVRLAPAKGVPSSVSIH